MFRTLPHSSAWSRITASAVTSCDQSCVSVLLGAAACCVAFCVASASDFASPPRARSEPLSSSPLFSAVVFCLPVGPEACRRAWLSDHRLPSHQHGDLRLPAPRSYRYRRENHPGLISRRKHGPAGGLCVLQQRGAEGIWGSRGRALISQSDGVLTSPFARLDGWPDSAEPGQLASGDTPG
jgi:hypothetical protein